MQSDKRKLPGERWFVGSIRGGRIFVAAGLIVAAFVSVGAAEGRGALSAVRLDWLFAAAMLIVAAGLVCVAGYYCMRSRRLEKLIHPLSLIPIQIGICDARGKIFFFQSGNPELPAAMPGSLSELPVEIQQEIQKTLPALFLDGEPRSVEFDLFKFRRKVDFFFLKENRWSRGPVAMWVAQDITKMYHACQERERIAGQFQQTIASIGDAVVVTNYDGEIVMMNDVAAGLGNLANADVEGGKIDKFFHFESFDLIRHGEKVINEAKSYPLDGKLIRDGLPPLAVEGTISPIMEGTCLVAGAVLCFRDISERLRMNRQEQTALKLARSADRAKSDFIAVMNHEFRSSLNTVIGYCELLHMNGVSDADTVRQKIQKECGKLLGDMDNLLDFSKSNFDNVEIVAEPANFKDLIYEIQHIFLRTASSKNIPLQIDVPSELPLFLSDYKVMRQILISFLAQAFSLATDDEVVLAIAWNAPCLNITIEFVETNRNPDVSESELPFNQQLLQLLKGTVQIRRENDKKILIISFPEIKCCGRIRQTLVQEESENKLPHRNIVIMVDDIPVNLKVLGLMLKTLHIDSIACGSAKEVLNELKQYIPAAILTDLWMPECNGDELAAFLKTSPQTADIPTVLITADNQIDHHTEKLFSHTMFKPFKMDTLKKVMAEVMAPAAPEARV